MKNLLFTLLFVVSNLVYGQIEKTFTSTGPSGIDTLINLVLKEAANNYHFTAKDTVHENAIESVYSDGKHKLIFEFIHFTNTDSANTNTISPVLYTFISVTGPYKDLFLFWKKYYPADAKMKAVLKASHAKVITRPYLDKEMISSFNKYGDNWEIENRYAAKKL